ncbi:MAG: S8 family peptidase, partial [Anaerolineaceae bacterium]|nr:S8 family peptidase [Anaerolineaceae bacterium]
MKRFPITTRRVLMGLVLVLFVASASGAAASPVGPTTAYIVMGNSTQGVTSQVRACGGQITSSLDLIRGAGARLSDAAVACVRSAPGIQSLTLNSPVQAVDQGFGQENRPDQDKDKNKDKHKDKGKQIPATDYPNVTGANLVWEQDTNGSGVTVAILDTGIGDQKGITTSLEDKHHRIVGWKDFVDGKKKPIDPNGHGTHVAGIIANTQLGEDQEWNGMAPGVDLVGVRVLDENGVGTYENVILGIQWVIDHKDEYNIRVMNLSLVSPVQAPYWADPLDIAVTQAWAQGITVVASAGNGGPGAMTIGVPGNNPYVITVGAFTDNFTPLDWNDDYITPFSAAGPTLDGFVKPDVVAPG